MAMRRLRDLERGMKVTLPTDENGLTGRECPEPECRGYFKVKFGTGLPGEVPCTCPYCGHRADQHSFTTKDQNKYLESVARRAVMQALHGEMKHAFRGFSGSRSSRGMISITVKLNEPRVPIHRYRDAQVETTVTCPQCTLHFAVYGVFAFCPDCQRHNTLDILERSLLTLEKTLVVLTSLEDDEVREALLANALKNLVSAFDGFGRELVRIHEGSAQSKPPHSFQNLTGADKAMSSAFGMSLESPVSPDQWRTLLQLFAKTHVFSHRMGVADEKYLEQSGDALAVAGRKLPLNEEEVRDAVELVRFLSTAVTEALSRFAQTVDDDGAAPSGEDS